MLFQKCIEMHEHGRYAHVTECLTPQPLPPHAPLNRGLWGVTLRGEFLGENVWRCACEGSSLVRLLLHLVFGTNRYDGTGNTIWIFVRGEETVQYALSTENKRTRWYLESTNCTSTGALQCLGDLCCDWNCAYFNSRGQSTHIWGHHIRLHGKIRWKIYGAFFLPPSWFIVFVCNPHRAAEDAIVRTGRSAQKGRHAHSFYMTKHYRA